MTKRIIRLGLCNPEVVYAAIEKLAVETKTPLWTPQGKVYPIDFLKPVNDYKH